MIKKINFRVLLIGLLLLLLISGAIIIILNQSRQFEQRNTNKVVFEPQSLTITEYIETTPEKYSVYKETVQSGITALQLLQKTTQVKTEGEGQSAFVVEINGRMADNSKRQFWSFYVNDQQSAVGAGSYILKDGDNIQWKLETY